MTRSPLGLIVFIVHPGRTIPVARSEGADRHTNPFAKDGMVFVFAIHGITPMPLLFSPAGKRNPGDR